MKKIDFSQNFLYSSPKGVELKSIKSQIEIEVDDEMYCPIRKADDPHFFRNDWTALAFRSFNIVNSRKSKITSLCVMGTGSGLDTIGAIETFSPKNVVITDYDWKLVERALWNIRQNVIDPGAINIKEIGCSFFENRAKFKDSKFDLIYENLPNIPDELITYDEHAPYGSFIPKCNRLELVGKVPEKYKYFLLTSHYIFLQQAKEFLAKDGIVICCIGGRVKSEIIEELFYEQGYKSEVILYDFKRQNEAGTNLAGYSQWENEMLYKRFNSKFIFYPYSDTLAFLEKNYKYNKLSGFLDQKEIIKKEIQEYSISADEANKTFKSNIEIGHEVSIILASVNK